MLLPRKYLKKKTIVNLLFLITLLFLIISMTGRSAYDYVLRRQSKYFIKLDDSNNSNHPEKIIFLWTPMFDKYDKWTWAIGPNPVISDCGNDNIDGKCLVTNHPSLLEKADIVLFSPQDIKQVRPSLF